MERMPESVIETDERVQVSPMTSPPYKWICDIEIESSDGAYYAGSGFKIHIPGVNRSAVVTAGHCLYVHGSYASRITVRFPGEKPWNASAGDLYAAPEYVQNRDENYDYGLILKPGAGDCDDGFGWSTIVPDAEMTDRIVSVCGYPVDKLPGTMWITGRKIERVTTNSIYYNNDTFGGQSGCPVYTWYGGYWTVIGIHTYGVSAGYVSNSATRFTIQMISHFLKHMGCLEPKTLESVEFGGVYVRCDGRNVTTQTPQGSGTVNCQYQPPSLREKFLITPVEITPSLASAPIYKVALESAQFSGVYVRMDSKGMSAPAASGGGEVNCQASVSKLESFVMKKERNGGYSFRNLQFPHCYIRMDGNGVTRPSEGGGGVVNCQYYTYFYNVSSSETFHVRD